MKFSDITGHKEIISSLKSTVDSGRIPHAILFSGVGGIGKFRIARALSQYIHCKNRQNGDSCGVCPSCRQHQSFNNPDLHFIYPILKREKEGIKISKDVIDSWKEFLMADSYMSPERWNEYLKAGNSQPVIYVEDSADILNRASLSSYQEEFKIFIIWLPEKLRSEAANKLLKVIEEPFEDTIFILVSNQDSRILPTILSRTQRYNFKPLSKEEISEMLIKQGVDSEKADEVAAISGGSLRKAEELACYPDEINEFTAIFIDVMRNAYALKAKKLRELAEEIAGFGREKILRFLAYCNRMIRENFIYNFKVQGLNEMTESEESFSLRFSPFVHAGNVETIMEELTRASSDIERNANSKIVLFDLFLLLSRNVRKPSVADFPENKPIKI